MIGRPEKYTPELGEKVAEYIATTSLGLKRICKKLKEDGVEVSYSTVRDWISDNEHPFANLYTRAKAKQKEHLAEELLDIADDGSNDLMLLTNAKGEQYEQENKEVTSRSKLRVEARKWLLSKLDPKKYGDKLDLTSDNKPLAPTNITIIRDGGN